MSSTKKEENRGFALKLLLMTALNIQQDILLAGFAQPNEMEKMKEEFCDNLLEKLTTKL